MLRKIDLLCVAVLIVVSSHRIADGEPAPQVTDSHEGHESIHTHNIGSDAGKIKSQIADSDGGTASGLKEMPKSSTGARKIIDLSYPLADGTLHWPENAGFKYSAQVDGERKNQFEQPYYVKSDSIDTAVHTGTHIDAPVHFSKEGWTIEQVPLERLIDVPVCVIDLSEKVRSNRTYNFMKEDFIDPNTNQPRVRPGSVVLVYTGISDLYSQGPKEYFGTDDKDVSKMKIPGFSQEAARYLVELGIYGVGLDAPSADSSERHGPDGTKNLVAHIEFNANNIFILENVNGKLKDLINEPAGSVSLIIAPLPIVGGSGSPVRLIAVSSPNTCQYLSNNAEQRLHTTGIFTALVAAVSFITIIRFSLNRCD